MGRALHKPIHRRIYLKALSHKPRAWRSLDQRSSNPWHLSILPWQYPQRCLLKDPSLRSQGSITMRTFTQLAQCYESPSINALDARLIASSQMLSPYHSLDHALITHHNSPYPTAWSFTPDGHAYISNAIIDCTAFIKSFPGSITSYCIGKQHLEHAATILSRFTNGS